MSRSADGYYRSGPRRRAGDGGYGGGGFDDYSDSYGSRRSSRDGYSHDRHRSSGGGGGRGGRSHRGRGMVNPWEGGVVPGSGGGRGGGGMSMGGGGAPDIVASINELSRMDNPESELALNILNAVLGPKEESGWGEGGGRDWGGGGSQKRRMDWDSQYAYAEPLGDGILPTPAMPPRKMPRREQYSWGVVDGFNAMPVLKGRKARDALKKKVTAAKPKPKVATTRTLTTLTDVAATDKAEKAEEKKKEGGDKEGEEEKKKTGAGAKEEEGGEEKENAEKKEGEEKGGEDADGKSKKTLVKKKEEAPIPVSYLRCHLCQMNKFNSSSNFMDHIRSKKHRRMIGYYGEKIAATEKLLKAQSWLKSQRNIVSMSKLKGKITRCICCECPIKGGRWTHIHIREHMLLYHFTKCFTCKLKFMNRSDLEQHKLTTTHMKAQFAQDKIAMDRFLRWTEKSKKETHIPEQKQSEEFHEMVKVMQMNNLDTFVWNKDTIPIYDPARPAGLNHLVKKSHFVCSVCPQRVSQTAAEALEHCRTKEHYDCLAQHLKTQEKEAVEAEKKKKEELKKKEEQKKKMEEKKKLEEKKEEGKEEEKKKEEAKTEIKQEKKEEEEEEKEEEEGKEEEEEANKEEQEEEIGEGGGGGGGEGEEEEQEEEEEEAEVVEEEEEEENGMKDMENMEVIDEEGQGEEQEEEEEEEGGGGEEMVDLEEVGEDMEEIGEDLLEEEEEGGEDYEEKEEEEEKEEKEEADNAGKTSTSAPPADESSAPAPKAAPKPAPGKAQAAPRAQTRSTRTRGARGARRGV
ncbi:golgin subfamily A member 6-like protein 22 [Eriocheir sinensis]|uniref:golgin subfamily A member 6-like protein 22 n=1 Tax=Eriocheir sinensis TaxID=95602 RepID=UPI0021CA6CD3|nr:golgin subfamily A member 6-like protein 22 [Eriocheir sinensis]